MKNENGQTLVIIFFVMIVALTVGLSTSSRLISSLRSNTRTQTGYRSRAIADAALERILLKSTQELEDYIAFNNCGSDCILTITNNDGVVETANVTLSYLGNSSDPFELKLDQDQTSEINLAGYPDNTDVDVCWNAPESGVLPSVVGMLIHGTVGNYSSSSFAYNSSGSSESNGFDTTSPANGYLYCISVNSDIDPEIIRIRALYEDIDAMVFPAPSTTLPSQGILIVSKGQSLDTSSEVSVVRTANSVPLFFDYAIYSRSESNPLSN